VTRFDFLRSLRTLTQHGVAFVVIGGIGGRLHGSTTVTGDVDICHARDPANLERLAEALGSLNARLRGVDDGVPFVVDAASLGAGDHFTFTTDAGDIDCMGTPAGVAGFEELDANASSLDLDGFSIRVASLDDLIRMKRAAGRPKDLIEVEVLGALRDEIDEAKRRQRRHR
jgi:predicted nucleotidyltransferase